jgi:hypothetical protein
VPESLQTLETRRDVNGAVVPQSTARPVTHRLRAFVGDHPFLAVFIGAFLVRLLVAVVLSVSGKLLGLAPDSAFFLDLGKQLAGFQGDPFAGTYWSSSKNFATYLVPVAVLFRIFGPSYFLAQLVAVLFGAITATATARLAREILPLSWSIAAGSIVAFFPSQVLWSSAAIRDSAVWATSACMALALAWLFRAESRRQIVLLVLATCGCVFLLGFVREYALSIGVFSLFIVALVVRSARFRVVVAAALMVGAMFIPVTFDRDILGTRILRTNDLAKVRVGNAGGADSAFVTPEELKHSDLSHLPQGLKVTLLEPLPWTSLHGNAAKWGRLEAPLRWLLLIGSFSAIPLLWRRRRVLGFVALYCGGVVLVLALGEGNFGTLDRHRGELVWPMTLLTVAGAHYHRETLLRWWRSVRHRFRPRVAVSG